MGITTSILLIAVGAILRWAVYWRSPDVDISTIGLIVFVVGLGALVLSLVVSGPWSSRSRRSRRVVDRATGETLLSDEERVSSSRGVG